MEAISVTVLAVPWMSEVPEYLKMAIGMAVVGRGPPRCWLASLKHGLLSGFLLNPKFPEKLDGRFSAAPLVDLSLSPPSGLDSPNGSSSLSPERQGNGDLPPLPTAVVRRGRL